MRDHEDVNIDPPAPHGPGGVQGYADACMEESPQTEQDRPTGLWVHLGLLAAENRQLRDAIMLIAGSRDSREAAARTRMARELVERIEEANARRYAR